MAKAKAKEVFVVGSSTCGDISQLYISSDYATFSSLAEAEEGAAEILECHEADTGDKPDRCYILKVVKEGRTTGVSWE